MHRNVCANNTCTQRRIWYMNKELHIMRPSNSINGKFCPSVGPSVRLSVRHTFSPCSNHRIIMKFSGVMTNDRSENHAKGQGQRSKVKVTEVKTQVNGFRAVTPVWIHIWWWNDAQSLMLLISVTLLFLRSSIKFQGHTAKKSSILTQIWAFPDCNSSLNSPMATKWCTKLEVA